MPKWLLKRSRISFRVLTVAVIGMATQLSFGQVMGSGWYWPTGIGDFGGYLGWLGYNPGWGYHLAQDMKNSAGNPVFSIGSGTILSAGEHGGYGNYGNGTGGCVLVRYQAADGTWFTAMYGHLDNYKLSGSLAPGEVVGYTIPDWDPPHLHFSIHPGFDPEPNNPWRGYTLSTSQLYGFTDPIPFLNAHPNILAPNIELYNQPANNRYYTQNTEVPWRVTAGSDPLTVNEIINGSVVASYSTHSGYVNNSVLGPGWTECWATVRNGAGSGESQHWQGGFDNVAPYAVRSGGAVPNIWYRGNHSIQWNNADAHSGPKRLMYRWNGGTWSDWVWNPNQTSRELPTYGWSSSLPEGKNVLEVEIEDNAWTGSGQNGNSSITNLGSYWLDNTAPIASTPICSPVSPSNAVSVQVTVSANDPNGTNGSGVDHIDVLVNGTQVGSVTGSSGSVTWNTSGAQEGTNTVRSIAYDVAGNASVPADLVYLLDRVQPTTSITLNPTSPDGLNGWYRTAPIVTVTANDPPPSSGDGGSWLRIGSGSFSPYAGPVQATQLGKYDLAAYSRDLAGNVGNTTTMHVQVDTTAPPTPILEDEGAETPNNSRLNVSFSNGIDPESGLYAVDYVVIDTTTSLSLQSGRIITDNSFLMVDGLKMIVGHNIVVQMRTVNGAGIESAWAQTDGIVYNPASFPFTLRADAQPTGAIDASHPEVAHTATGGEAIIGSSYDGSLTGGFWADFLPVVCPPTGFSLFRGIYIDGDLNSLVSTDQSYLHVRPQITFNAREAPVQLIVDGVAPFPSARSLKINFRCRVDTPNVAQTIDLFDWNANAYVTVDTRAASLADTTVEVVPVNPSRFMQAGTGAIRARVSLRAVGGTVHALWNVYIDLVDWTILW